MNTGNWQDENTLLTGESASASPREEERVPGLTILGHSDSSRVGERLALPVLAVGREVRLSRLAPAFKAPGHVEPRPLEDRSVSRQAIRLAGRDLGSVELDCDAVSTAVSADGQRVTDPRIFSAAEIERGVVLQIGRRVVLLLHQMLLRLPEEESDFGLVGKSAGAVRLRREIRQLAGLDVPVLLRGATGTGKELVARALHEVGPSGQGPFVAVNMAAVPSALAASELFGARRGAFTGADRKKVGFFQHAEGGTLFLDEIGETPSEVQPMLLRALETHEILPVGGVEPVKVHVRVIAATDARLEDAITAGSFRAPLLHRLAGYTVRLPALADRRDDVGRLLFFFLRDELAKIGKDAVLAEGGKHSWPPADVVARLGRYDWPGNVRELRNVARWLAIAGRGLPSSEIADQLEEILDEDTETVPEPTPTVPKPAVSQRRKWRRSEDVDEAELLAALRANGFVLKATATALGISRTNLYRMVEQCPAVRKASDLDRAEIEEALASSDGDPAKTAERLEVSVRGLKRRMNALGLSYH